jgi:hypothetical protein
VTAPQTQPDRGLPHNLDCDRDCLGGSLSGIAAVGECLGDERERAPRQTQDNQSAIAILNVGGLGFQDQTPSARAHHDMPLAAFDLLAGIIASRAAALGGFHALAVEHGGSQITEQILSQGRVEALISTTCCRAAASSRGQR